MVARSPKVLAGPGAGPSALPETSRHVFGAARERGVAHQTLGSITWSTPRSDATMVRYSDSSRRLGTQACSTPGGK